MKLDRIDAHQHFWHPARGDYFWMPPNDPTLNMPYGVADLADELRSAGVRQTVLVQAAPTVNETNYMLGIADSSPSVAGVVGWIDFENKADLRTLETFSAHPKFVGVRPMIQDIADDDWMLRDDIQWAYRAVTELGLTFDALGFPRHINNFLTLFMRHPDMRVVIDHCLKPAIADRSARSFKQWAEGISRIADETSAYCKLSGLVTEAGTDWSEADLLPYIEHVLEQFGPARVMWGSDWPVCLQQTEYIDWLRIANRAVSACRSDNGSEASAIADFHRIFCRTAAEFYGLPLPAP